MQQRIGQQSWIHIHRILCRRYGTIRFLILLPCFPGIRCGIVQSEGLEFQIQRLLCLYIEHDLAAVLIEPIHMGGIGKFIDAFHQEIRQRVKIQQAFDQLPIRLHRRLRQNQHRRQSNPQKDGAGADFRRLRCIRTGSPVPAIDHHRKIGCRQQEHQPYRHRISFTAEQQEGEHHQYKGHQNPVLNPGKEMDTEADENAEQQEHHQGVGPGKVQNGLGGQHPDEKLHLLTWLDQLNQLGDQKQGQDQPCQIDQPAPPAHFVDPIQYPELHQHHNQ